MTQPFDRRIGIWLLFVAFLIYLMIAIGGYTRLSDSGLSMVDWKPVSGWLPPLSEQAWQNEFKSYQESPEFIEINFDMDLSGFKSIYYPEFFHRVFGRIIGLAFFLPFFYFIWRKRLHGPKMWRYLTFGLLGGLQGGIGWFMVKSGLSDDPHVSAYRLAMHLSLAGFILWLCFSYGLREVFKIPRDKAQPFKWLIALVALQICSGAFVSGQKAGVAFRAAMSFNFDVLWLPELGLRNLTENLATVVFIHVNLGLIVFLFVLIQSIGALLKYSQKTPAFLLLVSIIAQVTLGFTTAANYSPRPLALSLAHQLVAFAVLLTLSCCSLICSNRKLADT